MTGGSRSLNMSTKSQAAHEHLNKGELEKAAEQFEVAANDAEETADARISCFINAGACFISLGDYQKSLSCLEAAANIIATQNPSELECMVGLENRKMLDATADIHYNSAIAYQALGNSDKAGTEFQKCIVLYEKSNRLQNAAEVLSTLALCNSETGDHEKEIDWLVKLQSMYKQLGDNGGEAVTCARLAKAHLRAGRKEECRQMLSMAKLISVRVDNHKILGRLYFQCGLIHSSLSQHNEALQNFERALPLVRQANNNDDDDDDGHLNEEASLLQNIGATYNEKQMYSESVAYHREAAMMHGRLKSSESEIQCLCNLAFAQSQLRDFNLAISTLNEALEKASQMPQSSTLLQFQALETLGTCYYHTSQYSEAVGAFNSAFQLLSKMQVDTSIAQDRVMGKLSDATRALQNKVLAISGHSKTTPSPEGIYKPTVGTMNVSAFDQSMGGQDKRKKRKQPKKHKETTSLPPTLLQSQDSCDLDLQAYQDTLISSSDESDNEQNTSVEQTHPTSTGLSNHHLHRTESNEATITSVSSHSSLLLQPSESSADSSQLPVTEGSLAIGPNARDIYTVQTSRTEPKGKRNNNNYRSSNSEIVERKTVVEQSTLEQGSTVPHSVSAQRSKICQIM